MKISDQLAEAMAAAIPLGDGGFVVKLLDLRHSNYPGRDAAGILPVAVIGHESMTEDSWKTWVRNHGLAYYGAGSTQRMIESGVDLKQMTPTAPFGRAMRVARDGVQVTNHRTLNEASIILEMVEKWPSLYNVIAEQLAEKELTLREFVRIVKQMPTPLEFGLGRMTTLGDLIGRGIMELGDY